MYKSFLTLLFWFTVNLSTWEDGSAIIWLQGTLPDYIPTSVTFCLRPDWNCTPDGLDFQQG